MKLFVREKLLSLHNRYYIYNAAGETEYEIESRMISIGTKTTIFDKYSRNIAYIQQEILHLMPHYNVFIGGQYRFQIKKLFSFLKNDYELSNNYTVEGSIFNLEFVIKNPQGLAVALINRKFLSLGDRYQIEILDENDLTTVLSIVVAITNDVDRSQKNN